MMSMPRPTVAMLSPHGPVVHSVDEPLLRADDHGVSHGDGAFETMRLYDESVKLLDEHLERFAHSMRRLEVPIPAPVVLKTLIQRAVDAWREQPEVPTEAGVRLVCTRGPEFGDEAEAPPTIFALVFGVPERMIRLRREGLRLASLSLGIGAHEREGAPWLLGGVKTLSYAVNLAAVREAKRRGADDALLVASDGTALEGTTSGVVWRQGDALYTVPSDLGILPSITVQHLLAQAPSFGLRADEAHTTVPQLCEADGVWMCSSVRGIVAVKDIDGVQLDVDEEFTARLREAAWA